MSRHACDTVTGARSECVPSQVGVGKRGVTRPLERRLGDANLQHRLLETLPEAATACWDLGAPPPLSAKVDFDAEHLNIELTGGNANFQTCVRGKLDRTLRTSKRDSRRADPPSRHDGASRGSLDPPELS